MNANSGIDEVISKLPREQQEHYNRLTRFIAFDPGYNTGMATFNRMGDLLSTKVYKPEELTLVMGALVSSTLARQFGGGPTVDSIWTWTIIYEDYFLRPDKLKEQVGSRMEVAQAIGQIKLMASATGSELVSQRYDILRSTAAHHGISIPSERVHIPDDVAAHLHGLHYLSKIGLRQVKLPKPDKYDL